MSAFRIKNYLPRGIYGRAALILIVPIVTIQLIVSILFIQRHFERVTEQMTGNVVYELGYVLARAQAAPDAAAARTAIGDLLDPLSMEVRFLPQEAGADIAAEDQREWFDLSGKVVIRVLSERLAAVRAVDLVSGDGQVRVLLETRHGPMEARFDRRRVSASNPHQLLVLMLAASLLMTFIAIIFLRNQLRPIRKLAFAASEFGKGRSTDFRPSGASEVRIAGNAFLAMRNRLERQIEQRTQMLSGVSHDLRTPLTRLKLSLGMMEDDAEVRAMRRDVDDMGKLLDAFLTFARDNAADDAVLTDPEEILLKVVENARRAGQDVTKGTVETDGDVAMRPVAVTRALENLVNNAVRYGKRAMVSMHVTDRYLRYIVEDDGPGIPQQAREDAVKPFVRLDAARNQDRGSGVGLGLSIALDVARVHGGQLKLGESESLGGLKAELVLAR